jgi:hypothetical protein
MITVACYNQLIGIHLLASFDTLFAVIKVV